MRRDAQAVLLLLVGGTLLKISLTGTYVRYVKPGQLPLLVAAGIALVAVAAVTLYAEIRARSTVDDHEVDDGHEHGSGRDVGHGHGHGQSMVGWLLVLPALALLLFAPPAVGAFQANRNGTALSAQSNSDFPPLPAGDPVTISLLDYAGRAVFDHGHSLSGRTVQLSGFIIPGASGHMYLARMVVTCCAADARPVKVGLTGDVPLGLKQEQWVEVTGTWLDQADHDAVNNELIPYVQVSSLQTIAAPELQYES
jgi:uncharacterized repeat protein (TIGR03943 family)